MDTCPRCGAVWGIDGRLHVEPCDKCAEPIRECESCGYVIDYCRCDIDNMYEQEVA